VELDEHVEAGSVTDDCALGLRMSETLLVEALVSWAAHAAPHMDVVHCRTDAMTGMIRGIGGATPSTYSQTLNR